jgi:hypothetical protein
MVLGMSLATYTFLHVLISLIGIGSGLVVLLPRSTGDGQGRLIEARWRNRS